MPENIRKMLVDIIDFILPPRTNFAIVKSLDVAKINNLSKAEEVSGADWIHPLFHYRNNKVRAIIWELKYRENILPLEHIGKLLYEEILDLISDIVLFTLGSRIELKPVTPFICWIKVFPSVKREPNSLVRV